MDPMGKRAGLDDFTFEVWVCIVCFGWVKPWRTSLETNQLLESWVRPGGSGEHITSRCDFTSVARN